MSDNFRSIPEMMKLIKNFHHIKFASLSLNLPQSEFMILNFLYDSEIKGMCSANIGRIARDFNISHPAVSRMVSRLESKGYVKREADDKLPRASKVVITDSGKEALLYDVKILDDFWESVTLSFGRDRFELLLDLMQELYDTADDCLKRRNNA